MWLTGLDGAGASHSKVRTAIGALDDASKGFGASSTGASGGVGKSLESEASDDLALKNKGRTSSIDVFSCTTGTSSSVGLVSSMGGAVGAVGAATGSGFFNAKTECPATELRLRVLVKNEGLGLAAEMSDGPKGVIFTVGLAAATSIEGNDSCG